MNQNSAFQLDISIRITPVTSEGHYPNGGTMEIRESETVSANSFLEVAGILGKFHELAQAMKAGKS